MKKIDHFLNSITMYQLVLKGLQVLALIAIIFSFFGWVTYSPLSIFVSVVVLSVTCHISNYVFAKLFKAQRTVESAYITAFILVFLIAPPASVSEVPVLVIAGILAMASKYILAIRKKHLFNPAAISIVILGLFGSGVAVWWVATPNLALPVALLGFGVVRKLQRMHMFGAFAFVSLAILLVTGTGSFTGVILSWPLLFLGTIMLTEPTTVPPTKRLQIIYGSIVGVLFATPFHFGPVYSTPELALVLGNIFSYLVGSKDKVRLFFVKKVQASAHVYDFVFEPERRFRFIPGQFMDWILEHEDADSRGDRRTFTISSSPTDSHVRLGVRMDLEKGSSFKKALFNLEPGASVMVSELGGDFVMPKDITKKLAFVAGGVGITPYRSMIAHMKDTEEKRDTVLLYSCATSHDFAFRDEIESAKQVLPLKTVYITTDTSGFITEQTITDEVSDYLDRHFYISGPEAMVENYEKLLLGMGVSSSQIHTDYFPGY